MLTTLQALATSPSLHSRDFAAFYAQVSEIRRLQGIHISLRDTDGHTVLTTRAPLGTPVPVPPLLVETDREILRGGQGERQRRVHQRDLAAARVPDRGGARADRRQAAYLLAASLDLDYLVEAVRREHLPPGWIGLLVDRRGVTAVRSESQADYAASQPRSTCALTPMRRAAASTGGTRVEKPCSSASLGRR